MNEKKQELKLVGATFKEAVAFGGTSTSVSLQRNCDALYPARLEADGSPVAIDKGQRADGLVLRRKAAPPRLEQMAFVPWANVSELQYGESDK